MPETGAPPPPPSDDFEPWEIETVNTVINAFLLTHDAFLDHEREDLQIECLMQWYRARGRYRGRNNASVSTYFRAVVRHKLSDLLEAKTAQKRGAYQRTLSLDEPIDTGDKDSETLGAIIAGHSNTEEAAEEAEVVGAVRRWIEHLPTEDRRLIEQLLRDPSLLVASRALYKPRTTLQRRFDRLKVLAFEAGLRRFLD